MMVLFIGFVGWNVSKITDQGGLVWYGLVNIHIMLGLLNNILVTKLSSHLNTLFILGVIILHIIVIRVHDIQSVAWQPKLHILK